MELGGREILIGLGVLLVVAILLDGFRRTRSRDTAKLRVRRRKQPIFDEDDFDASNAELPGDGPRVVQVRDEQSAQHMSQVIKQKAEKNHSKLTMPFREPEQALLSLDEDSLDETGWDQGARSKADAGCEAHSRHGQSEAGDIQASAEREVEQDVIILHLMARAGERFAGSAILEVLLSNGFRYDSKKIFQRHKSDDGAGEVLFSLANSVNPGTFELDSMADFSTPGLSFFMIMQDTRDPMYAFEQLLSTMDIIKGVLGGELKDAGHSALTRQTAEHYREQIMDYNRRQLAS